jgi:hypothetical protein
MSAEGDEEEYKAGKIAVDKVHGKQFIPAILIISFLFRLLKLMRLHTVLRRRPWSQLLPLPLLLLL